MERRRADYSGVDGGSGYVAALLRRFFGTRAVIRGCFARAYQALSLYGRERVGAALLIAITFRLLLRGHFSADAFWIGWIAPGLVAADIERQGVMVTLSAVIAASLATAFSILLLCSVRGSFA